MQQAVVAAGRPGGDIVALNQRRLQPAQRAVARDPGAGGTAANNNDVIFTTIGHLPVLCVRFTSFSHIDRV